MSFLSSLNDSVVGGGLKALGVGKNSQRGFTTGQPSVVNAVPVIYGRPGWVKASPVIVGYRVDNWQEANEKIEYNRLCVHHICGEGLMRTPEAFKVEGRLVAYSKKYSAAEAEVLGGALASYYLNSYTSLFSNGWPTGQFVNSRLESTRDVYSDNNWPGSFNSLAGFVAYHNTRLTADKYLNAVPTCEFLPNGVALHDPRISFTYADSFVYFIPQVYASSVTDRDEILSYLPKGNIGGVARGWYADTIWPEIHGASDAYMEINYPVYNHTLNDNNTSQLGDSPDNNPALVFLDYMIDHIYGAGIPFDDVSMNHIIASANYADEQAPTYQGGPTQEQMACNIQLSTEEKLSDNLESILKTCRGLLGWVDGQYQLHIPRAGSPVVGTIDSDTIIKRRGFSLGQKSKRLNRVIATYIEPNKGYQENQLVYPPVGSAEDILWRQTEDDGELNEKEITLEGCTNAYQAADLSAVIIRESRASITAEYELNLSGLKYTLGDVVRITDPDGAFTSKLFYIRKWQFDFERRVIVIGVSEYADAIYDVLAHPVLERAPGTLLGVDPMVIPNVTGLSFAPAIYNKTTLGELSWDFVNHSAVTNYDVRIIGPAGDVAWSAGVDSSVIDEATLRHSVNVPFLNTGTYTLEVRARSSVAVGDYTSTTVDHNSPVPVDIVDLKLVGVWVGRDALIEWLPSESAAFKRYVVEVRASAAPAAAVLHSEYATDPRFDLTYDKNNAAGLSRSHVIAVAVEYDSGAMSAYSTIAINNAAPVAPTSIATAVLPNSVAVSFDITATDSDFMGSAIEFRESGGAWSRIDLDASIRHHAFNDLDSSTAYELRLLGRDVFGDGAYSSTVVVSTVAPISPTSFSVLPGVNMVTLNITAGADYSGCDVWIRPRNSAPGNAAVSWSGSDRSVVISELLSGTNYSVYYAPIDKKGVRGSLVNIPFTTTKLEAVDLSGLSPWATKLDAADAAWISDKLEGNAIESSKIANLAAAKLTAGIINATIGISSGGSIESSNAGYKTGLGVYDVDGTIYTLMTANSAGNVTAGITADGVLVAKGADISGKITIESGSTGYAGLTDKPTSLAGVNSAEANKLAGIAAGADVTDYSAVSSEIDGKVDAIEVGGRNLLINSNYVPLNSSDHGNANLTQVAVDEYGEQYFSVTPSNNGNIYWGGGLKLSATRIAGQVYTLSFDIKTTQVPGWGFYFYVDGNRVISNIASTSGEWKRHTFTFIQSITRSNAPLFGFHQLRSGEEIGWRKLKIEKGNKATDWTPAPEDVEAFAEDKKAEAIAANSIIDLVATGNLSAEGNSITRTAGGGDWDSGAYSKQSYIGGACATCTIARFYGRFMMGLDSNPEETASFNGIDFALYASNSYYEVYENGTSKGVLLNAVPKVGDVLSVEYDGVYVRYSINGVVYREVMAASNINSLKLHFDASFTTGTTKITGISLQSLTNLKAANDYALTTTKTVIDGGLITTGSITLSGSSGRILAGKSTFSSTAPGFWLGVYDSAGAFHLGNATDHIKFDKTNGLSIKGKVAVAAGSSPTLFSTEYDDRAVLPEGAPFRLGKSVYSATSRYSSLADLIPVVPGETLTMEMWAMQTGSTVRAYMGLEHYDINKKPINNNAGCIYRGLTNTLLPSNWTKYTADMPIHETHTAYNGSTGLGVYYVRVRIIYNYNTSGQAYYSPFTLYRKDRSAVKTVIDGGLVTTGAINLISDVSAGHYGKIHSGKTSVVDTTDGFWLAATADGGELNIGNAASFMTYTPSEGLTFSGTIFTSDAKFIVDSDNTYTGAVLRVNTTSQNQDGISVSTYNAPAILGTSTHSYALKLEGTYEPTALIRSNSNRASADPCLVLDSNGGPHLRMSAIFDNAHDVLPTGINGDFFYGHAANDSSLDGAVYIRLRGKWRKITTTGSGADGSNIF